MNSAGAKSVMSEDMKDLTRGEEDISNQVQGHKANLSNPNTSEASKKNSQKVIDELGGNAAHYGDADQPKSKSAAENLDGDRLAK